MARLLLLHNYAEVLEFVEFLVSLRRKFSHYTNIDGLTMFLTCKGKLLFYLKKKTFFVLLYSE